MKKFDSPVRDNILHMRPLRDKHNGSKACNDTDPRPTLRNRVHRMNWLQVLGDAEPPPIDERVGHQLHAIVPTLMVLEPQPQPLTFVLPGKRPFDSVPSRMESLVEPPLATSLGRRAMSRVLRDVRNHPRIDDGLAM